MKIRNGFVSNSSSSSFIVAIKGDGDLEEMLTEVFKVPETSPMYALSQQIVTFLVDSTEEWDEEKFLYEHGYKSMEDAEDQSDPIAEYLQDGYRVYYGLASYNETDDPIEMMIGNGGLDEIETDEMIVKVFN